MPTPFKTDTINGKKFMPEPNAAGQVVAYQESYAVAAALLANDIVQMVELPENCVPDSFVVTATDLDTNGVPAITLTVGLLNAAGTDIETAWLTASTIGQAGGAAEQDAAGLLAIAGTAATAARRKVGIKCVTAPATGVPGTLKLNLRYRPA